MSTNKTCTNCPGATDHDTAQPSPAPELELPEVVTSFRAILGGVSGLAWEYMDRFNIAPTKHGEIVQLMTVAQHDRIVGELLDRIQLMEAQEVNYQEANTAIRAERDAFHARVEQQDRTIAGMNEAHAKLAGLYEAAQARVAELEIRLRTAEFVAGEFAPVAQAGQVPEEVRILLARAQGQIEHLAECAENLGEDLEDDDVSEDVEEARALAEEIGNVLAAAPAQGGE